MSYVTGEKCLELYEKDIQAAKPLLKTLKKYSRVVWLDQVPLIEADLKIFRDVINEKLLPMNRLARRLLQDSGVVWWDDYAAAAAEYARACALWKRNDTLNYENCRDDIRQGSGVVSTSTKYLLNRLCRSSRTTCADAERTSVQELARIWP